MSCYIRTVHSRCKAGAAVDDGQPEWPTAIVSCACIRRPSTCKSTTHRASQQILELQRAVTHQPCDANLKGWRGTKASDRYMHKSNETHRALRVGTRTQIRQPKSEPLQTTPLQGLQGTPTKMHNKSATRPRLIRLYKLDSTPPSQYGQTTKVLAGNGTSACVRVSPYALPQ